MNTISNNFNDKSIFNSFPCNELPTAPTLLITALFMSICFLAYKWSTLDSDPPLHNLFKLKALSKNDLPETIKTIELWKKISEKLSQDPSIKENTRHRLLNSKEICANILNRLNYPNQTEIFACYDKKTTTLQSIAITFSDFNIINLSELATNPTNIAKKITEISHPVKGASRFLMYNLFYICLTEPLKAISYIPYPLAIRFYEKLKYPNLPISSLNLKYTESKLFFYPSEMKKSGYEKHIGLKDNKKTT